MGLMNKEKLLTLIHSPYITEKSTSVGSMNQVVFKVDLSASKSEIKKAVEDLFDVKVESVTTSTQKGKTKEIDLEYTKDRTIRKLLFP